MAELLKQTRIALYQAHNIDECIWPETADGRYAQASLTPLIKEGVSKYIDNIHTKMGVLKIDDVVLPITVNEAEYSNSYVCSPYSFYISYAKESLDVLSKAWLCNVMNVVLSGLGIVFKQCQINKVVAVNNWLYSTNLYPQIEPRQLERAEAYLRESFPDYAIVFRSVDPYTSPVCYNTLWNAGCEYIATRQIYLIEPHTSTLMDSRLFKSDLKLLKNSGYEIIKNEELTEEDIPRLLNLYRDLYIDKYSELNPKFNENFLRLVLRNELLHLRALKRDGVLDGVVGYMVRDGKMYCPFFGYDKRVPKEQSLYRLLSTVLMLEAYEKHLFFHQSSGASMYKTIRKAVGRIEYTAVFTHHLSSQRQLPWALLANLYNSVGKFYMKRY